MCTYLGNMELLERWKIGFIASRTVSTTSVLPALDWAVATSRRTDVAVVSGFHSRLERDVLQFLLRGRCGIIVVLARGMYRKLPKLLEPAMTDNRLLVISLEKETVTRTSEHTAHKRNKHVAALSDELKRLPPPHHP